MLRSDPDRKKLWNLNSRNYSTAMNTMHKKKEYKYACIDDNDIKGLTPDLMAPWDPYFLEPPAEGNLDLDSMKLVMKWANKKAILLRKYGTTAIMFPDITPKVTNDNFYTTMNVLLPILKKDCPRSFRNFFEKYGGWVVWRSMIIPEALNYLITQNAVKCTRVVLEGKAPELQGVRANPNWMNQYGHFPLHQAADRFNIDMIKLLIANGALANVRTAEDTVIGGLLPLHVAVENTCMHKYLEDNLFPNQEHPIYSKADVYKLIHLLCLPEMKIFLDATKELAKHTNDLVDEIWNYIKVGRLIQAGVLLFAAQEHIRPGPSCRKNGNSKPDGFAIIARWIINSFYTLDLKTDLNEKEHEQTDATVKHLSSAFLLVNIISQAGGALYESIWVHKKVPHVDVFERVSSILKGFGFCPPEEGIDTGNLSHYKCGSYQEFLDYLNFNQHGQFPLHHAAETFSVPMIKLLISKGASANVRMAGDAASQGLLPLHVAVENTCLHRYLEDNRLLNREHPSYSKADIYNLIHLLCLPEMKNFLDAIRELAKHTNDLIGEVCNYIKGGKLVHAGVLLFAAQEHICLGSRSKKNGNRKSDGFATIVNWIADGFDTFDLEMVPNERVLEQPYVNVKYKASTLLLVDVISHSGKALHEYISVHSQVPHVDILERVSAILKDFGFCPTAEGFDIGNICICIPRDLPEKHEYTVSTKKDTKMPYLNAAGEKAEMKKALPRIWELRYQRALFFPYWRSVLSFVSPMRLFPAHATGDALSMTVEQLHDSKSRDKNSAAVPDANFHFISRIQKQFNHQSRRSFSTAATLMKVLKTA